MTGAGNMKYTIRIIIALATLAYAAATLRAQDPLGLQISASLQYTDYLIGEKIPLAVTVKNPGTSVFIIDDYPPYTDNKITVYMRDSRGTLVFPNKEGTMVDNISVKAGEEQTVTINVADFYNMSKPGRYQIYAVISRGKATSSSSLSAFSVVSGISIGSAKRVKEGYDNIELTYTLLYWARSGKDHLFLRVKENPGDKLFGFSYLGTIVRVAQPTIEFAPGNSAIVTHQTSRDNFTRTTIDFTNGTEPVEKREALVSAIAVQEEVTSRQAARQVMDVKKEEPKKRSFFSKRTTRTKQK